MKTYTKPTRQLGFLYATPTGRISSKYRNLQVERLESLADVKRMSKPQRIGALVAVVLVHILLLTIFSGTLHMGLTYGAADDATSSSMATLIASGVFDSRAGLNNSATHVFKQISSAILAVALPFMSAFAILMTTISLVSSVIYFSDPDKFDHVAEVHDQKGQKKLSELIDYGRQVGLIEFLWSLCPNFKQLAFRDAIEAGPNGQPTFKDFLKTLPK